MTDDTDHRRQRVDAVAMARLWATHDIEYMNLFNAHEAKVQYRLPKGTHHSANWLTHGSTLDKPIVVDGEPQMVEWINDNGVRLVMKGDVMEMPRDKDGGRHYVWPVYGLLLTQSDLKRPIRFFFELRQFNKYASERYKKEAADLAARKAAEAEAAPAVVAAATTTTTAAEQKESKNMKVEDDLKRSLLCSQCGEPGWFNDDGTSRGLVPCFCLKVQYCDPHCAELHAPIHSGGVIAPDGKQQPTKKKAAKGDPPIEPPCSFLATFWETSLDTRWRMVNRAHQERVAINREHRHRCPVRQVLEQMKAPRPLMFITEQILRLDTDTAKPIPSVGTNTGRPRKLVEDETPTFPFVALIDGAKKRYEDDKKKHIAGEFDPLSDSWVFQDGIYYVKNESEIDRFLKESHRVRIPSKSTRYLNGALVCVMPDPHSESEIIKKARDGTDGVEYTIRFKYGKPAPPLDIQESMDGAAKAKPVASSKEKKSEEKPVKVKWSEGTRGYPPPEQELYEEGIIDGFHESRPFLLENVEDLVNLCKGGTAKMPWMVRMTSGAFVVGANGIVAVELSPVESSKYKPKTIYVRLATREEIEAYHRRLLAAKQRATLKVEISANVAKLKALMLSTAVGPAAPVTTTSVIPPSDSPPPPPPAAVAPSDALP